MRKGQVPLTLTHPHLCELWSEQNVVSPDEVSAGSNVIVEWICDKGHTYPAPVFGMASGKRGCSICSGRRVVAGINDLATISPGIAAQWSPLNDKRPNQVTTSSNYKALWECDRGHTYPCVVAQRTSSNSQCPVCLNRRVQPGVNDLASTHPVVAQLLDSSNSFTALQVGAGSGKTATWRCPTCSYSWKKPVRDQTALGSTCRACEGLDLHVGFNDAQSTHPHLSLMWSPNNVTHMSQILGNDPRKFAWSCDQGHDWVQSIEELGDCLVCAGRQLLRGVNDVFTCYPQLAKEWSQDNSVSLSDIAFAQSLSGMWNCEHGHAWKCSVQERIRGRKCIYCSRRKLLSGFNDMSTTHPDLAAQWHSDNLVGAHEVMAGDGRVFKWKCEHGHEWSATANNRLSGTGCPVCSGKKTVAGFNDLATTHPHLFLEWHPENEVEFSEVGVGNTYRALWQCANCSHQWRAHVYNRTSGSGCPRCVHRISRAENEVYDWIKTFVPTAISGDKKMISPYELDIYFPEHKFAIEYNGLYWHSEARGKDRHYHQSKLRNCQDKGITLFQIWEDDWQQRRQIVERMILHRLGLSGESVIYARKTQIVHVSYEQAAHFLNQHHIQGQASGSDYVGLFEGTSLVAVAVFKSHGELLYLERYATSCRVVGGLGKIIKDVRLRTSCRRIVTFADLSLSQGNLYEKLGFAVDGFLPPDYTYLVNNERKHKFNYRIARFKSDPALKYEEGLSERQLAALNGLVRLWDSGKARYVLDVEPNA